MTVLLYVMSAGVVMFTASGTFAAPPVACTDPEDGDLTDSIGVEGTGHVDASRPGGYYVYCICRDSDGNSVVEPMYVVVEP